MWQRIKDLNWPVIASVLGVVAGAIGTILTPIFGASLAGNLSDVLQGISGLLMLIPLHHAGRVVVAKHLVKLSVATHPANTGGPH